MTDEIQQPNTEAQEFRCPECSGKMGFDAATGGLKCQYCGHTMAVPAAAGDAGQQPGEGVHNIVEYDLEHGLAQSAQRGYGAAVRTTQCQECGATVSFAENVTATQCEFCGSSQVMQQDANRNVIRPESLVPFQIDQAAARDKFSGWLRGLWFRPSDLKHKARVADMAGVYVPYWTFDANVDSDWTAQAGYHYYETESYTETDSDGETVTKTRQVQRTRWEPAWGKRSDFFDDFLICASRGLPPKLADKLETFDTRALRPYEPGFLAGWRAEEYAIDLNTAWHQAVDRMEGVQQKRCAGDVPGDTHRFLNVTNRFYNQTFKHVLLPIWISAYRYEDKVFRFLVNGQTGEVTGKAPLSVVKIVLFVAAIIAVIALIVVLASSR